MSKEEIKNKWEESESINLTDGSEASNYLKDLIKQNVNGKLSYEEILKLLKEHYKDDRSLSK